MRIAKMTENKQSHLLYAVRCYGLQILDNFSLFLWPFVLDKETNKVICYTLYGVMVYKFKMIFPYSCGRLSLTKKQRKSILIFTS